MSETRTNPQREFIRHTADVPLEVRAVRGEPGVRRNAVNVSVGGVSFESDCWLEPGSEIEITINQVDPPFHAHARVAWCHGDGAGYCVGAQFLDANDAFRARMVEQVCTIESYRRQVSETEGRTLTTDQAAAEWITRFAGRFPDAKTPAAASSPND